MAISESKKHTTYDPSLLSWPLVMTILDGYEPRLAPVVTKVALEYEAEVRGLVMKFWAEDAEELLLLN